MLWIVAIAFVLLLIFSLNFRLIVFNIGKVLYYSPIDLWNYIVHKGKNNCPTGFLDIYTGLFGKGKTLSAVKRVIDLYNAYNGKKVWCPERKKFVTQKVHILSNIKLSVPYVSLESLQQVVEAPELIRKRDFEEDTLTIILVLIDEISVQLNSRNFKTNVNAQFLNSLLCCRHYHMGFIGTAQRFSHVDALLRQVTQKVIECNKLWRLQRQYVYDAFELENCTNITNVRPLYKTGFFVTNKNYAAYDTMAVVGSLVKSWKDNDMLSDKDILELQGSNMNVNVEENNKRRLFGKRKRK